MDIMIDKRLRELRQQRGNRQEELADHLGVMPKWHPAFTFP